MCTLARLYCFPNRNRGVRKANGSYSGSIRCVLEAYWLFSSAFGGSNISLCMFKINFIGLPNVPSMCIREVFGRHSMNIRHLRKTFGKHASSFWCIWNDILRHWDPYAFRTHRMVLDHDECFPIVSSILSRVQYSFRTFSELLVHFQYVPCLS